MKEHIAKLITEGTFSISDYSNLLRKAILQGTSTASSKAANEIKVFTPEGSLAHHYQCLQCGERGSTNDINKHAKKAKHDLALDARSFSLYCTECKDLVYDPTAERIRASLRPGDQSSPKKRKSCEANGDDSYLAENSSQRKCGQEGVRGLFNLGETCYMNAILQMMVHNQLLSSYFLGDGHPTHSCSNEIAADAKINGNADDDDDDSGEPKTEYQPCVGCAVSKVFAESRMSEKPEPMEAVNLLYASWKAIPVSLCAVYN